MAADIPTKEPLTIRASDTIEWTKSIDDYKASDGWTLSYSFRGTGGTIDITSSAEGIISISGRPTLRAMAQGVIHQYQSGHGLNHGHRTR